MTDDNKGRALELARARLDAETKWLKEKVPILRTILDELTGKKPN